MPDYGMPGIKGLGQDIAYYIFDRLHSVEDVTRMLMERYPICDPHWLREQVENVRNNPVEWNHDPDFWDNLRKVRGDRKIPNRVSKHRTQIRT